MAHFNEDQYDKEVKRVGNKYLVKLREEYEDENALYEYWQDTMWVREDLAEWLEENEYEIDVDNILEYLEIKLAWNESEDIEID